MGQSQPPNEHVVAVPADVRARVMPAVLDELARWGVERFSIEALAERHRLDAALADVEQLASVTNTGSLRGDLAALAQSVTDRNSSEAGRTFLRALVMDRRGRHDEDTRMMFWGTRFSVVRAVIDRARERGELRDGVNTTA